MGGERAAQRRGYVERDAGQADDADLRTAVAAYERRDKNALGWRRERAKLKARGKPALLRLLDLAKEPERAHAAFGALRSVSGELIPDDVTAWSVYLESK